MSTRANYEFYANGNLEARFYIHHDGYPQGAAGYFHKALLKNNGYSLHSYFIDAFYKANEGCEISPRLHGDIEYLYKYDVELEILTVIKIDFYWDEDKQDYIKSEDIIFKGTVQKFVNSNFVIFEDTLKEYDDVLHSWDNDKVKEQKIRKENIWLYGTCLKLLKLELAEHVQTFNENLFNLSADNVNVQGKKEKIDEIINKILAIKKEIEEA